MSCCSGTEQMARMEPMTGAYAFSGSDMQSKVLMNYTGPHESEWINCTSGNHYVTGKGQQFQADAGDVDDIVTQGVAEVAEKPEAKAEAKVK